MANTVIACFKWVCDEADIVIDSSLRPDFSRARSKISDYDRQAIEEAVQVASTLGGNSVGLTLGAASAAGSLKDALSRGLDEVCLIDCGDEAPTDYTVVTEALGKAVGEFSDVALVICAEGSSDLYGRQTASRLGAILDWPTITGVVNTEIEGTTLRVKRRLEDSFEILTVQFPAVISVLPEINQPSLPGMKAILEAKKKPQSILAFADLGVSPMASTEVVDVVGYQSNRKQIVFDSADDAANVVQLVEALRKEGVLS